MSQKKYLIFLMFSYLPSVSYGMGLLNELPRKSPPIAHDWRYRGKNWFHERELIHAEFRFKAAKKSLTLEQKRYEEFASVIYAMSDRQSAIVLNRLNQSYLLQSLEHAIRSTKKFIDLFRDYPRLMDPRRDDLRDLLIDYEHQAAIVAASLGDDQKARDFDQSVRQRMGEGSLRNVSERYERLGLRYKEAAEKMSSLEHPRIFVILYGLAKDHISSAHRHASEESRKNSLKSILQDVETKHLDYTARIGAD